MKRALLFPGQGAQTIGMGKGLSETYPAAKAVFEEVDDALSAPLSKLIWSGEIEELTLTQNTQPALMATSLAAMRALEVEGVSIGNAQYVAGHSLGEYSALAAAKAISISEAARLLQRRGLAMQAAVSVGRGAMAALLGLDYEVVVAVASEAAEGQICQVANDNDPGQVVVSGDREAVERAVEMAKSCGAKRAIMLPVSAPFHCELMAPAAEVMAAALSEAEISTPVVPVISNVLAKPVSKPDQIRQLLVAQVTGMVRWRETVSWLSAQNVAEVWELGAGKALCGMVRRIDRTITCRAVVLPDDVITVAESLKDSQV